MTEKIFISNEPLPHFKQLFDQIHADYNNKLKLINDLHKELFHLPDDVKQLLDDHKDELLNKLHEWNMRPNYKMGFNTYRPPWLPNYIIKYGVERINNVNVVRDKINELNLTELAVPLKYYYKFTNDSIADYNTLVISQYINGPCGKGSFPLTLEQTKQLICIADTCHHYDIHRGNLVLSENKVYIIDTDSDAIPSFNKHIELQIDFILNGTYIHDDEHSIRMNPKIINDPLTKMKLSTYSKHQNYSQEAESYISFKCKEKEEFRILLKKYLCGIRENSYLGSIYKYFFGDITITIDEIKNELLHISPEILNSIKLQAKKKIISTYNSSDMSFFD